MFALLVGWGGAVVGSDDTHDNVAMSMAKFAMSMANFAMDMAKCAMDMANFAMVMMVVVVVVVLVVVVLVCWLLVDFSHVCGDGRPQSVPRSRGRGRRGGSAEPEAVPSWPSSTSSYSDMMPSP